MPRNDAPGEGQLNFGKMREVRQLSSREATLGRHNAFFPCRQGNAGGVRLARRRLRLLRCQPAIDHQLGPVIMSIGFEL